MEETAEKISIIQIPEKEEIDWARYLDYTRFFKPADINFVSQDFYKGDIEKIK